MFSDDLQKIDKLPHKTLFGVAAGLVILCQLVAIALVANGQVAKARERDARHAYEQMAVSQCMETNIGAARHDCIQQTRMISSPAQDPHSQRETQPVVGASTIEHAVPVVRR